MRALADGGRTFWRVAEDYRAGSAGFIHPRHDRLQQFFRPLALRHKRASNSRTTGLVQYQQQALRAGELRRFVHQERLQLFGTAHLIEPQPRVDQALERFAQVRSTREMRLALCLRKLALPGMLEPRTDNGADLGFLVKRIAAQSFVAQAGHGIEHEAIRLIQCLLRFCRLAVGAKCLAMPPPHGRGVGAVERSEALSPVELGRATGRCKCLRRPVGRQMRASGPGEKFHQLADVGRAELLDGAVEMGGGVGGALTLQRDLAFGKRHLTRVATIANFLGKRRCDFRSASRVRMPHQMFRIEQVPDVGQDPHFVADFPLQAVRFEQQAPRPLKETQREISDAEVAYDGRLAVDDATGRKGGERFSVELQAPGLVRLVKRQHIERLAVSNGVAAFPRQRQCLGRGTVRLVSPPQCAEDAELRQQRAVLQHRPVQLPKPRLGASRVVERDVQIGELGSKHVCEQHQRTPFQLAVAAGSSGVQPCAGCRQPIGDFTATRLQERLTNECTRFQRRTTGALCQFGERHGIGAAKFHFAADKMTFSAQVEKLRLLLGSQVVGGQRGGCARDGRFRLTGPGQLVDLGNEFGDAGQCTRRLSALGETDGRDLGRTPFRLDRGRLHASCRCRRRLPARTWYYGFCLFRHISFRNARSRCTKHRPMPRPVSAW